MPDRTPVRPSAVAYRAMGWPYFTSDPQQGFFSSEDIEHGQEFDQFVEKTLIPFINKNPEVLSGTGVARVDTQQRVQGRAYDVPYPGKLDVALYNSAGKVIGVQDAKVATPSAEKTEGYFNQVELYGHAVRNQADPVKGITLSLFYATKPVATAVIESFYKLGGQERLDFVRQIVRRMVGQQVQEASPNLSTELEAVRNIQYESRPLSPPKEFEPGGQVYKWVDISSREAELVERWTGFHPRTLGDFERGTGGPGTPTIPQAWRRDMRDMYEIVGMLAKGVTSGQITEQVARQQLAQTMQQYGVRTFDPVQLPPRQFEQAGPVKAIGSPLGLARTAYGKVKDLLGAKAIVTEEGRFILPDIESEKPTGEMPVIASGRLGEFQGRPTIDDVLVTPTQFDPTAPPSRTNIFQELQWTWRKAIEEGMTERQAMRLVNERRRSLMAGMPRVGPVFSETSTAAGEALNALAVKINQSSAIEPGTGEQMSVQRWYEVSKGLVARGHDPSLGYPVEALNAAIPGHVSTPGRLRTGLFLEQIAKLRKRVSMAARRDYMLSAAPETGRNVVSMFRMEGAPRSERGIHFNVGYSNLLPEGMMYMDAATMRQMDAQGGFVLPHQEDIPLPSGLEFTPDEKAYQGKTSGAIPLGKLGSRDLAFKAKQFLRFAISRAFQTQEAGESLLRIQGEGRISGEQELIKSWLGTKAVGMSIEDLNKRVGGGRLGIEALMPIPQASREELYSIATDYYSMRKRGFELLTNTLQSMGLDPYKEGLVEDYDPEEREWARKNKGAIQSRRLVWGEKLDPYILQIGRAIQQGMMRSNVDVTLPMSYEEAETYARVFGRDALGGIDLEDWRQNRDVRKDVTLRQAAMPVGGRFFQMEKLWTGKTTATLGELGSMPERMAERALQAGGHRRQFYENMLRAGIASRDPAAREGVGAIGLNELRKELEALPKDMPFIEKMSKVSGRFVDIGGGFVISPLPSMAAMSVPGEIESLVNPIPGTEADQYPTEEHNALIHYLETLTRARGGSGEERRAYNEVRTRTNRLLATKAVAKALVSSNVTGQMGTEGTYAFVPGLRPNEVLVGEKALRELTGMSTDATSIETLNKFVSQGMVALGQRRPDVLRGVTTMPGFRVLSVADARKMNLPVPAGFQGMGFSQMVANQYQGDADGDQAALFLATAFNAGKVIHTPGEAARGATEAGFIDRQFRFLELITGEKVGGPRTWENYLKAEQVVSSRTGMKASELAKWMQSVGKAPKTVEEFFGSMEQLQGSVSVGEARQSYMVEQIAQKQRGDIYNPFVRNLTVAMKAMGMVRPDQQETLARVSYFAYQASLDEPVSAGMRTIMAIMNSYSVRTGAEEDPASRGRLRGRIRDLLSPVMGKPPEREIDFHALPGEIIQAVLSAEEFRGFGDPTKDPLNKAWHKDIASLLAGNEAIATRVQERLAGISRKDIEKSGDAIVQELLDTFGGVEGFWKEAGPLTAVIGARIANRGLTSKSKALRGIMGELTSSGQWTRFGKGQQPVGGFGFFGRLAQPMLAAQRVESGTVGPGIVGTGPEEEEARATSLLSDLAAAGQLPGYVSQALGKRLHAFRQSAWEGMQRIRLGGLPHFQEYDNPEEDDELAMINDEERQALEARRGLSRREREVMDEALKARVSGQLSAEEFAARFDPNAPPPPGRQGGGGRPPRKPPPAPPMPEEPPDENPLAPPGGVMPSEQERAAAMFAQSEAGQFIARKQAEREAEQASGRFQEPSRPGYKQPGRLPGGLESMSAADFIRGLASGGSEKLKRVGRVLASDYDPQSAAYKWGGTRFQEQVSQAAQMIGEGQTFGQAMGKMFPQGVGKELFEGRMQPAAAEMFTRLQGGTLSQKFVQETFMQMKNLAGGSIAEGGTAQSFRVLVEAAQQQRETNKYLKDFSETLQIARRHTDDFGETLKRIQIGRETATERKWAQEMLATAPPGDPQAARNLRGLFQELGFTPEQRRAVGQQMVQLREAGMEDTDPLSRAALARTARSSIGRLFGEGDVSQIAFAMWNMQRAWRMTGGQVTGRMGDYAQYMGAAQQDVAMMGGPAGFYGPAGTVRRGQVAAQRFGLSVGRAGWDIVGPGMEFMSGMLGMEDPDRPSLGSYALAAGGLGLGGLFALAGGGRLASMVGLKAIGEPMTGLAENIAVRGVSGLGAAARGGRALFQGGRALLGAGMAGRALLGGAGLLGGALGIATLGGELLGEAGANIGESQGGETGAAIGRIAGMGGGIAATRLLLGARLAGGGAVTGPVGAGVTLGATVYDETIGRQQGLTAGQIVNSFIGGIDTGARLLVANVTQSAQAWEDAQRTGAMWAERAEGSSREGSEHAQEAAKKMEEFAKYSDFGKMLEGRMEAIRQPMEAGAGLKVGAALAQATGMDLRTLMRPDMMGAAQNLMIMPPELQAQRLGMGVQMGRMAGVQWGGADFARYIQGAINYTPQQYLQAQFNLQQISPLSAAAQRYGIQLPQLTPEFMTGMTPTQRAMLERVGQGDITAISQVASRLQFGGGQYALGRQMAGLFGGAMDFRSLIQVEPETLQRAGTTDVSMFTGADWAMGRRLYGRTAGPIDTRMSLVEAQSQQREADRSFQAFQLQQRMTQEQRQGIYALGGNVGGFQFAGSFALEQAQMAEGVRAQRAQLQLNAGRMNFGWIGQGLGAFQGMSSGYGDLQQMGAAGLSYRQFYENQELQRRQTGIQRTRTEEDVRLQYGRQMVGFGWQEQDLTTNFSRTMTRFNQSLQDLTTGFQRGQTQFGWGREDISAQASRQALGFGWQMEDIDEAMRYATGRERRRLARQRERGTISYGMDVEQTGRERERLDEREKWAQEDFNKERSRIDERRAWAAEDFDKERNRLDVRRAWAEEDLERALRRLAEQGALDEEQFSLRAKHFEEDMKMSKLRHDESVKHLNISTGLQAKAFEERKKQFEIEHAAQIESIAKTIQHNLETVKLQDQMGVLTSAMSYRFDQMAEDIKNPSGKFAQSLSLIVTDITGALGSSTQPTFKGRDTVFRAFERLTDAIVSQVNRTINELTNG